MSNPDRTSEVLTVSAGSFGFALGGTFLLLVITIFTKLRGGQLMTVLLGREASTTLLQASQEQVGDLLDTALSNNFLGRTTVFVLWMFVGLLVFMILAILQKAAGDVREIEQELESVHVDKAQLVSDMLRDVLFRTGVAFGWTLFALLSFQLILPFFVSAIYVTFGPYALVTDMLLGLVAAAVVMVALHIHVIFARLFVGRVRLFGS